MLSRPGFGAQAAPSAAPEFAATRPARHLVPFRLIEPAVFVVDLLLVIAVSVATGAAYIWIAFGIVDRIETFFGVGVIVFANFAAILLARGDYRVRNLVNFRRQTRDIVMVWSGVFLVLLGVAFSLKIAETFSRGATISFFIFGLAAVVAWRGVLARYLARALAGGAFAERKIVLLGEKTRLVSSSVLFELQRCGYKPVSTFEIGERDIEASGLSPRLRDTLDAVIGATRREPVEDIFLLIGWERARRIDEILTVLRVLPVPIHLVPDENVSRFLGSRMVHVGRTWTAELKRAPLTVAEQALKRSFDILVAGAALVMLSPLILITALLVKLDFRGSVLFTQTRHGFSGRSFRIFKFRTMRVLEDGPAVRQATRDDPRVTRLGSLLRRTSIDELPQLFNVLRGEMSLVGPRPHAAAHNNEYETLIAYYAFRYNVKPGITGWAQVNGYRGETQTVELMAQRVELDLWYINNWSIWLDVRVLIKTVVLGFHHPKAY
jgi:undecaprenyl-phosphate galactose phosphotransferase/putative colanic acid biosynthesis UDP-glucose lipid carrier transferase